MGERMKREQAKIWSKLSKEELKTLGDSRIVGFSGILKHYEKLKHFASGGCVEMYHDSKWEIDDNPVFSEDVKYRKALPEITYHGLKVRCNPPATRPLRDHYWIISAPYEKGYIDCCWRGTSTDKLRLERGEVFLNESDVQAIVKALGWVKE